LSRVIRAEQARLVDISPAAFEEIADSGEAPMIVPAYNRPPEEKKSAKAESASATKPDPAPEAPAAGGEGLTRAEFKELTRMLVDERRAMDGKIQEAYERGMAEGEHRGREETRRLAAQYAFGLEKLSMLGRTLETLARHEALEIALLIARRIIQKEIELNPMLLVEEVKRAASATIGRKELTIRLHPEDLKVVRELAPDLGDHFPAVAQVNLAEDASLEGGDCVVDTDVEQINLSLTEQLAALKKALEEEVF